MAPSLSVAVSTTAWLPTFEFAGVPDKTFVLVLKFNQDGRVVAA